MIRQPPKSTSVSTLFPDTALFRFAGVVAFVDGAGFIDISGVSIETSGGPLNGTVGSFGVLSKGAGARIDVAAIPIATSGQFAEGLRGELGATINTTGSQISTSGEKEIGRAHV